jgi:predicted GTPase
VCVVVSEAVGYLNALRLGRRVSELIVMDGGDRSDDVIVVVGSNTLMREVL